MRAARKKASEPSREAVELIARTTIAFRQLTARPAADDEMSPSVRALLVFETVLALTLSSLMERGGVPAERPFAAAAARVLKQVSFARALKSFPERAAS